MRPPDMSPPEHFAALPCGTRAKYVAKVCRCVRCRAANSRYERERAAKRRAGEADPLVPATAARAHLAALSRAGIGRRVVSAAGDVPTGTLAEITQGRKLQIRRSTERRILAVDASARAGGTLVDAGPTWRLIGRLLEEGFTKTELARRLRFRALALQLGRRRITARNAVRVERFYWTIMAEAEELADAVASEPRAGRVSTVGSPGGAEPASTGDRPARV
jgi:hypothetical protein